MNATEHNKELNNLQHTQGTGKTGRAITKAELETLHRRSLEIITENQAATGAFLASPAFSQYQYSWFRDGVYIAYSLLVTGEQERAEAFIQWSADSIVRYRGKIEALPALLAGKEPLEKTSFLGARYTIEGEEDQSDWPNFQIDGYGSWLWLVAQFLSLKENRNSGVAPKLIPIKWVLPVQLLLQYLELVWELPNSDCWEEFEDKKHPATLACLAGGLKAIAPWLEQQDRHRAEHLSRTITSKIIEMKHPDGFYPKYEGSQTIDASLIWLCVPYKVIDGNDPALLRTINLIEEHLLHGGGVQRYPQDTYYGGGQWILLSAFLGWYYLSVNRVTDAEKLLVWIVNQQTQEGYLPEQVSTVTNEPSMIRPWEERWGLSASPLLWSHAMFLILEYELSRYNHN